MIFLNSASSAAALVFDLPLCTHTDNEGKPREAAESGIYFEIFKKTQYLMNTLYIRKALPLSTYMRYSSTAKNISGIFQILIPILIGGKKKFNGIFQNLNPIPIGEKKVLWDIPKFYSYVEWVLI